MSTTHKPLTTGELMAALAGVPAHTPVKCAVHITSYLDADDAARGWVDYNGNAAVTGCRTALNEVVLEVEE